MPQKPKRPAGSPIPCGGVAATLGLTRLQEAARVLEAQLRSHHHINTKSAEDIVRLMEAVRTEQVRLHEFLARIPEQG